ncbi:MAG: response regulator [Chloroflexota bacterium]
MALNALTLLLIEDNPGDARLIREMLRALETTQIVFNHVETLSAGLKFLQAQKIDVVLLDLSLPDSFGLETLHSLREKAPDSAVVVLTGFDDHGAGVSAVQAGAQEYLVKGQVDSNLLQRAVVYSVERNRIERALRKSEESYRSLIEDVFNSSSIATFIVDRNFCAVWLNRAAENYFGIRREVVLGKDMRDLIETHIKHFCEESNQFASSILNAYKSDNPDTRIGCHVLQDEFRNERWLEHTSRPIHFGLYAGGRIIQYTDVTDLKRAEQAEHTQRIFAEGLRDVAATLTSTLDLDEVLDRILENVETVVLYDAANIIMVNESAVSIVRQKNNMQLQSLPAQSQPSVQTEPYLERMFETQKYLICSNIQDDPLWTSGSHQEWRHSFVGVPISLQDRVIGYINLYSLLPAYYTEIDAERLTVFAGQAAIAIQNARLHQELQNFAAVQERQRLARELHDSVTQALFSSTVMADSALRQWDVNPDKAQSLLTQVHNLTSAALAEMRILLLELRPQALVQVTLNQLIEQLARALKGRRQIEVNLEMETLPPLPPDVKLALYRVLQEITNNIIKHSDANKVDIIIQNLQNSLRIIVRDDGLGFDLDKQSPNSLGLGIMRERAEMVGAALTIHSAKGHGTEVIITWPYQTA